MATHSSTLFFKYNNVPFYFLLFLVFIYFILYIIYIYIYIFFFFFTLNYCIGFAIHQYESATGVHMFQFHGQRSLVGCSPWDH